MYPVPTAPIALAAASTSQTIRDRVVVVGLQVCPATFTSSYSGFLVNPRPLIVRIYPIGEPTLVLI